MPRSRPPPVRGVATAAAVRRHAPRAAASARRRAARAGAARRRCVYLYLMRSMFVQP